MKLLAIGAHPDDIEIFMYGLVALYKKRGDTIHLAVATDGAAGKLNNFKNLKVTREYETINALKLIGTPDFLGLPDGKLSYYDKAQLTIDNYIKKIEPNLIVTHSPNDYHPDHRALSLYVSQSAGFSCPVLYADNLMGVNFLPEVYVDISSVFKDKINAIAEHKSQSPQKFVSATTLLNRFRSAQCNGPDNTYAEAYGMSKTFPFSDIRDFLPESPKYRPYYSKKSDGLI